MLNAVLAGLLLLISGAVLVVAGLRVTPIRWSLVGIAGLIVVLVFVVAAGAGAIAGGVTLFVALATLLAAIGFFILLWTEARSRPRSSRP